MARLDESGGRSESPAGHEQQAPGRFEQRRLHTEMIAAVIEGGGLDRIAELASDAIGAPVAIIVPRLGHAVAPAASLREADIARLRRYTRSRITGRPSELPAIVAGESPVSTGDEVLGTVLMLTDADNAPERGASEVLGVAGMAALTALAVETAREEANDAARSSLIELIRGNPELSDEEILRRAHRLGSDLSMGAVALCAELLGKRPRHVMSVIRDEQPQALAEQLDDRVYALLPPARGEEPVQTPLESGRRLAEALAAHAIVGFSSFCAQPRLYHRAIAEAELVVDVLKHEAGGSGDDIRSSTYRLLINTLASRPEEVTQFYQDTVAPLVRYDEQYKTDLVGTVEAYLRHNCNMNATASAIYAHRHTVAYRLDRVRELTNLDPTVSEDRERLGLGLKAYRILAPQLRR
jgi:PucR C-terminal helix-turn-helix domain/GGDEF-like domain